MADFKKSIGIILGHEGGYCNVTGDTGGETYRGISRKHNPNWEGWKLVDMHKPLKYNQMISDPLLDEMVGTYYYKQYWNAIECDKIRSQQVATFLMDWYVNAGKPAVRAIQRLVNVTADGLIGPGTLAAINNKDSYDLFLALKQARGNFYKALVEQHPGNAKFLKGWLARVNSFNY